MQTQEADQKRKMSLLTVIKEKTGSLQLPRQPLRGSSHHKLFYKISLKTRNMANEFMMKLIALHFSSLPAPISADGMAFP